MGGRPTGISILAILNGVAGFWNLWIGSMFLGLGVGALFTLDDNAVGGYAFFYGILVIVVGLVLLLVSAGYWTLQPWAWLYGLLINAVNLVLGVLNGVFSGYWAVVLGIILPAVILFYLTRPHVRAAFGRA